MDENKKVDEKEAAALNKESSSVSEAVHTDSAEQAEVSKSSEFSRLLQTAVIWI